MSVIDMATVKEWTCLKGENNPNYEIHSDGSTYGACAKCEYWKDCLRTVTEIIGAFMVEHRNQEAMENGNQESLKHTGNHYQARK